ncbi:MAG: hypothetical protein ACR2FY_18065 [Pirellulaceae bacterium]
MSIIPCCRRFEIVAAVLLALLSLAAEPKPAAAQSAPKAGAKKPSTTEKPGAATPKPAAKLAEPATAEEAAKVLDLRTLPLMEGAKITSDRTLGMLMHEAKGTPKAAFEFHRQQLVKLGFKQQPGGYSDKTNSSGDFTKEGFLARLSTYEVSGDPTKAGWSNVTLVNGGNVALDKLPVPPGVKSFHPTSYEASYTTDAKPAETAAACRKLLLAAGWEPYGEMAPMARKPDMTMQYFKRNNIKLLSWVMTMETDGKTLIRYNAELLSVDLPAPPDAADPRYTDHQKRLWFESPEDQTDAIFAFYQERLPKQGWKATTEKPIADDGKKTKFLVYRNPQKDMLSLDTVRYSGKVGVTLTHQSAAEVAEGERLAKAQAEVENQRLAAINKKVKVVVPLPANAKKIDEQESHMYEYRLATGSGPKELTALREHYLKEGWTEGKGREFDETSGIVLLTKGFARLTLSYWALGVSGGVDIKVEGTKNVVLEPIAAKDKLAADQPGADEPTDEPLKPVKKKPAISGLPPGIELPADVQDLLKKALEEAGEEKKDAAPAEDPKKGKKPKAPELPFPELPPGVELPDEVKEFLKKGLEEPGDEKPTTKTPATKKPAPAKKPTPKTAEPKEEDQEIKETPKVAAARRPATQEGISPKRKTTEKSLGEYDLSKYDPEKPTLWISPNGRRVAYLTETGIVIDGEEKDYGVRPPNHPPRVKPESFSFSPDSKRTGYVAYIPDKFGRNEAVVLDGKVVTKGFSNVGPGPIFSPDSQHYACICRLAASSFDQVLLIDGEEGKEKHENFSQGLIFTPDSKRIVYGVKIGENYQMREESLDGSKRMERQHGFVNHFFYGPAGQIGYIAREGDKQFVFYDGKEDTNRFDEIQQLIVSDDGKHVAYIAEPSGFDDVAVINGKPGKVYGGFDSISKGSLRLSPDGSRAGYAVKKSREAYVVLDGKDEKAYVGVMGLVFSPDSKRVAYTAIVGNKKWLTVVDGKEGAAYDALGTPGISPDSKSVVMGAKLGEREFILLNGQPQINGLAQKGYQQTGAPRFSPDGSRLVYLAKAGGRWLVVDSGKEQKPYDAIDDDFYFSADSRHLATLVADGEQEMVVVDGLEGNRYDMVLTLAGGEVHFDAAATGSGGGTAFHYLAARGNELLLVEETIQE